MTPCDPLPTFVALDSAPQSGHPIALHANALHLLTVTWANPQLAVRHRAIRQVRERN